MGFEVYDILEGKIEPVSESRIDKYVEDLLFDKEIDVKAQAKNKLKDIMSLFNENHKFLTYGIFILRKRSNKKEPYLFCS